MPFGVVSGIGRGIGVLDGWRSLKTGAVWGLNVGHPFCNQWGFNGEVILAVRGSDAALPKLLWDMLSFFRSRRLGNLNNFDRTIALLVEILS